MQLSCLNTMSETTVNSILTFISIVCTLGSGYFAWRTKEIKKAIHKKLDTIDLIPFVESFEKTYLRLADTVRSRVIVGDSEEGKQSAAKANTLLLSLNKVIPLLDKDSANTVQINRASAIEQIERLNRNQTPDLNCILSNLDRIDQTLRNCADKMKKE